MLFILYFSKLPDDMAKNVCKNVEPMDIPPPLSSYMAPILGLNISKLIIDDIVPRSFFLLNE